MSFQTRSIKKDGFFYHLSERMISETEKEVYSIKHDVNKCCTACPNLFTKNFDFIERINHRKLEVCKNIEKIKKAVEENVECKHPENKIFMDDRNGEEVCGECHAVVGRIFVKNTVYYSI